MKSGKRVVQEDEDYEEDDLGATKKDAASSSTNNNTKDGKSSDKANAVRSKHSVTEQRRRIKINERYQQLRELIPAQDDQKKDTASFLLEVIDYVKHLQKEQKNVPPYEPLNSWRDSHWGVPSFADQSQTMKNDSGPGSTFPARFDENSVMFPATVPPAHQNFLDPNHITNIPGRPIEPGSGSQSSRACPSAVDALNNGQDELSIEGGTINFSSVYSQRLLNSLSQALQTTGVDLSQASISVQINLGKRANIVPTQGISIANKDHGIPMPCGNQPVGPFENASTSEDMDQAQKRQKF